MTGLVSKHQPVSSLQRMEVWGGGAPAATGSYVITVLVSGQDLGTSLYRPEASQYGSGTSLYQPEASQYRSGDQSVST